MEVICSGSYLHQSELNEDALRLEIPFTRSPTSSQLGLHANQKASMLSSENQKASVTSTQTSLIIAWHWLRANKELLSQKSAACRSMPAVCGFITALWKTKASFICWFVFSFSNLSLWPLLIMGSCRLGRVQKHYPDVLEMGITPCQQPIRQRFNGGEIQLVPKGRISR